MKSEVPVKSEVPAARDSPRPAPDQCPRSPMTDQTTPAVEAALDHIAAEYRTQDNWAAELMREHAEVQTRLATLQETYMKLTLTLAPDRARARQEAFATLLPPLAQRTQGPQTPRTRAIETFLSVHRHLEIGAQDLHIWLKAAGEHFPRELCGTELARRSRDGYLKRVGRGRYRVTP